MNIEELRAYCLAVKGAEESMPFGEDVLVFKVMGKMIAFTDLNAPDGRFGVALKCDPERSVALREQYRGIGPSHYGAHTLMWNNIELESDVPDELIRQLIDHSLEEVVRRFSKKKQEEYRNF
jgi:predicted DNA-binding protein (MmcQ/YjbR family)